MQTSTVKSALIGVGAVGAVIALTGGAFFKLGSINKVNATSSLVGSTKHSMLSVTNSGAGPALNLSVAKGKAPFTVNSSGRVANLNASLLTGLAASQFVQGGGQSRSFGFSMPVPATGVTQRKLLSLGSFGTLDATCGSSQLAQLTFKTGSHGIDVFGTSIDRSRNVSVGSAVLKADMTYAYGLVTAAGTAASWQRQILRYTTGTGRSSTTHMATVDLMMQSMTATCDFDASAVIGPGVKSP